MYAESGVRPAPVAPMLRESGLCQMFLATRVTSWVLVGMMGLSAVGFIHGKWCAVFLDPCEGPDSRDRAARDVSYTHV